jgi:hypothetical protein
LERLQFARSDGAQRLQRVFQMGDFVVAQSAPGVIGRPQHVFDLMRRAARIGKADSTADADDGVHGAVGFGDRRDRSIRQRAAASFGSAAEVSSILASSVATKRRRTLATRSAKMSSVMELVPVTARLSQNRHRVNNLSE